MFDDHTRQVAWKLHLALNREAELMSIAQGTELDNSASPLPTVCLSAPPLVFDHH